jgi:hypothetical protein
LCCYAIKFSSLDLRAIVPDCGLQDRQIKFDSPEYRPNLARSITKTSARVSFFIFLNQISASVYRFVKI